VLKPGEQVTTAALYDAFTLFQERAEGRAARFNELQFSRRLRARGLTPAKVGHASVRGWKGISLRYGGAAF